MIHAGAWGTTSPIRRSQQVIRLLDALDALGMADNTIMVMTADHGELNGAHQMWGKGTCTYREQNYVPFIISHPAYMGGNTCEAVTSHVDVVPTLLQLTGMPDSQLSDLTRGLPGRSAAPLLANPQQAPAHALRAASLFNYHMLLFVDAQWCAEELRSLIEIGKPLSERLQQAGAFQPNLALRGAIRSVFDGRYRFSRYFSLLDYNTPRNLDELYAHNDVELYDLKADPDEVDNLAIDKSKHRDLLEAMNTLLNTTLAKEVSHDDGRELPMRGGKVTFVNRGHETDGGKRCNTLMKSSRHVARPKGLRRNSLSPMFRRLRRDAPCLSILKSLRS
ncbi:sulfatase-like hydrolase/transferase [Paraburkholderia sp. J63]|uniref:sulfatase-like hydrolase/transferase n=1 Tax=Paraburkholderia sp. J63 TaxID=2805434 RepID=UPI002ABD6EE5|nr:sulfatase-like hydrolase/transferase [Paraburkholderia sp. J63]